MGRFNITKNDDDREVFKTPTLRDVALTAPYMHNGSLAALEDILKFYSRGGNENAHQDAEIRPLDLSADQKRDLLAFLKALAGQHVTR